MDAKRLTPRHIIIKRPKVKDKKRLLKEKRSQLPDGCQMGGECGRMSEEVRRVKSTNRQLQNSHGDVKYSTGNGEAKELIGMTHGHEQQWGGLLREQGALGGGKEKKMKKSLVA